MIRISWLIVACFIYGAALQGCTTPLLKATPQQLESWVEEKRFAKAYTALKKDKVEIDQTQKQQWLEEIAEKSDAHWQRVKEDAGNLAKKEQWKSAKEELTQAIDQLIAPAEAEESLAELLKREESALYSLRVNEAIARGHWLDAEYKLQQKLKESTQGSVLTPIVLQQLQAKQQALSAELLEYANQALENNDLRRAKACHQALKKLMVPETLTAKVTELGEQLSKNKKDNLASQQKAIVVLLDKSIKQGQLVEATQQIKQLKRLRPLPEDILRKIDAVNSVLSYNAEFLDEKAEGYYRDGNLELASTIWEYLLKLDPNRTDIKLKLTRSEKVLKNMQELRLNGHRAIN